MGGMNEEPGTKFECSIQMQMWGLVKEGLLPFELGPLQLYSSFPFMAAAPYCLLLMKKERKKETLDADMFGQSIMPSETNLTR